MCQSSKKDRYQAQSVRLCMLIVCTYGYVYGIITKSQNQMVCAKCSLQNMATAENSWHWNKLWKFYELSSAVSHEMDWTTPPPSQK